ncbi:hypothetical protein CANINC_002962 [Pichia inconspicua]|uniref:PUM-HD domain-containing protein n=1 Tax=Pichia inconspicua TaxID=52247 RepID=A0A4T0WZU1_9ASCO|nr:hypothetical protein CANINC_002962 [[Candida] inconspicua]
MSDQATLSSFDDSFSQITNPNITTTTTPPMGEYSVRQSKNLDQTNASFGNSEAGVKSAAANSILSSRININSAEFESLPNVLSSLNLDENVMFPSNLQHMTSNMSHGLKNGLPSTPPHDWNLGHSDSWSNAIGGNNNYVNGKSSTSTEEETANNTNINGNGANSSFILNDSYLFDQSPSSNSILSPNAKNRNGSAFHTPILSDTSKRLNIIASPNSDLADIAPTDSQAHNTKIQLPSNHTPPVNVNPVATAALHPALTNNILSNTVAGESLGMGIQPHINGASLFNNYIPNQLLNEQLLNPTLLHTNSAQMDLNMQNAFYPPTHPQIINPSVQHMGYGYNINAFTNRPNAMDENGRIVDPINMSANTHQVDHHNQMNTNQGNNYRNNLGLNSTANIHRKHSSNNKRGEDASRFINATLNDFTNEIYHLCKDQHGCRFLQRQLELNDGTAATKIFNEIQLNVIELMIDPFGNYLIQKLLERVDESQRTILVKNASSQFVRIALDPHGTRALQKLVECVSTETEFQIIISSLSSYVVLLSRDLNGNHVIQKCLQKLPAEYCDFIFNAACDNCVKIAKHRHGCCVLQRCFDHGTPEQCERLALKVGENGVELSVDPYGNYVVQYVLTMEENRLRIQNDPCSANKIPDTSKSIELIISSLANNLTKLSTHKFGSNVIEKSLRIPTLSPFLIEQLLQNPAELKLLLHDAYGNYVLQTSLDVADDSSFKDLSELLKPYLNDVKNTPHGRRILSKLISRGGNNNILGESFDLSFLNYENVNNPHGNKGMGSGNNLRRQNHNHSNSYQNYNNNKTHNNYNLYNERVGVSNPSKHINHSNNKANY